jgi:hypothetical protein
MTSLSQPPLQAAAVQAQLLHAYVPMK